jgi:ribonuclease P protein component
MLPKIERFSTTDFSNLKNKKFKKTNTLYGFFVIYPEDNKIGNKKGIILSKKNFKTSISRNRHKRLFYNTILSLQKENPELKDKSFVFHPKKSFKREDLEKDLLNI